MSEIQGFKPEEIIQQTGENKGAYIDPEIARKRAGEIATLIEYLKDGKSWGEKDAIFYYNDAKRWATKNHLMDEGQDVTEQILAEYLDSPIFEMRQRDLENWGRRPLSTPNNITTDIIEERVTDLGRDMGTSPKQTEIISQKAGKKVVKSQQKLEAIRKKEARKNLKESTDI